MMSASRIACAVLALGWSLPLAAQELDWQPGPTTGALSSMAEVEVPDGYLFLDGENTRTVLQMMENPVSGREIGSLAPASEEETWWIFFEFGEVGYVEDDDNDLDADALLEMITEGTAAGNDERRRRGWPPLDVVGWQTPPYYDATSQNLEWAVLLTSEGQPVVNHNTRVLGRRGVMEVSLVCAPDELETLLPEFRELLAGFTYTPGNRYAEFTKGDKVAAYGLAGLIAGGSLAAAAKTGLLKKFGKLIAVSVVAIFAAIKKLFGRG